MPVWASILVAVVAAATSGAFGAWLVAWNDRHERFRDRLIAAADDFVVDASDALIAMRNAIGDVRGGDAARAKEATDLAWSARDAVLRRSARVDLLFGPGSETGRTANDVLHELANARYGLSPPQMDPAGAEARMGHAMVHLTAFQRAAFEEIRRAAPPSATIRESVRRSIRAPK